MKKIISLVTALVLILAFAVSAFAMPLDEEHVEAAKDFKPKNMTAAKVSAGDITIDGNATPEDCYSEGTDIKVPTSYDNLSTKDHATGVVRTAWSKDKLYAHIAVKDSTKDLGGSWNNDGVEIYVDYDQTANGKKTLFNAYGWQNEAAGEVYAAQLRVTRAYKKGDNMVALCYNPTLNAALSKSEVAVTRDDNGYVVEIAIPLKGTDGKYLPISDTVGFTVQINDGKSGSRYAIVFINDGIQNYAWSFSHLFENLKLDEAEDITWSNRTVKTAVSDKYVDFDPNAPPPSVTPEPPASEEPPAPVSIEEPPVSSEITNDTPTSSVEDTSAEPDEPEDEPDEPTDDKQTSADGKEEKGGLPLGALIGIIAGGVVVLAGAAVAVIIIMKKKKTA